jgi:hypothetical protein
LADLAVNTSIVRFLNSVSIGELDDDGNRDLAVANSGPNVSVLKNNGDGTFAADVLYDAGAAPSSVAIGDLDGDIDPAVSELSDKVWVLKNNGDGTFAAGVSYGVRDFPFSVAARDLDGDGDLDLAVANAGSNDVSILLNDCSGGSISIAPDELTVLRGFYVSGDVSDVAESDDSYLKFNQGITLLPSDPQVWLAFDGTIPIDNPISLSVAIEAHANTVGLTQTVDMYNFVTGQYEQVDSRAATFNGDSVVTWRISPWVKTFAAALSRLSLRQASL